MSRTHFICLRRFVQCLYDHPLIVQSFVSTLLIDSVCFCSWIHVFIVGNSSWWTYVLSQLLLNQSTSSEWPSESYNCIWMLSNQSIKLSRTIDESFVIPQSLNRCDSVYQSISPFSHVYATLPIILPIDHPLITSFCHFAYHCYLSKSDWIMYQFLLIE